MILLPRLFLWGIFASYYREWTYLIAFLAFAANVPASFMIEKETSWKFDEVTACVFDAASGLFVPFFMDSMQVRIYSISDNDVNKANVAQPLPCRKYPLCRKCSRLQPPSPPRRDPLTPAKMKLPVNNYSVASSPQ